MKRQYVKKDIFLLLNGLVTEEVIDETISQLLLDRLLLRGSANTTDDGFTITIETARNADFIYPGYAAKPLYELLSKNSILMEMYVDDVWVSNISNFSKPKAFEVFSQNSYIRCLDYLDEVIETERKLLGSLKSVKHERKLEIYSHFIGSDLISAHLYEGLASSLKEYVGVHASEDIENRLNSIKNKIQVLQKDIWTDEVYI